jgi:hypothetical protein
MRADPLRPRFLEPVGPLAWRPQLLTRASFLPVGRDIPPPRHRPLTVPVVARS